MSQKVNWTFIFIINKQLHLKKITEIYTVKIKLYTNCNAKIQILSSYVCLWDLTGTRGSAGPISGFSVTKFLEKKRQMSRNPEWESWMGFVADIANFGSEFLEI